MNKIFVNKYSTLQDGVYTRFIDIEDARQIFIKHAEIDIILDQTEDHWESGWSLFNAFIRNGEEYYNFYGCSGEVEEDEELFEFKTIERCIEYLKDKSFRYSTHKIIEEI